MIILAISRISWSIAIPSHIRAPSSALWAQAAAVGGHSRPLCGFTVGAPNGVLRQRALRALITVRPRVTLWHQAAVATFTDTQTVIDADRRLCTCRLVKSGRTRFLGSSRIRVGDPGLQQLPRPCIPAIFRVRGGGGLA